MLLGQSTPVVPYGDYMDALLGWVATVLVGVLPYAAAITAFAIGVGMVRRWLGHRSASTLGGSGGRCRVCGAAVEHEGDSHCDRCFWERARA